MKAGIAGGVVVEGRSLVFAALAAGVVLVGPMLASGEAAQPVEAGDLGFEARSDSGVEIKLKPVLQPTFHPPPPPY